MFLIRKLVLLGAAAVAVLALTAGSASAQLEVHAESGEEECGEVTVNDMHQVEGGCSIEFQGTVDTPFHVYVPNKVTVFSCEWQFEARVGEGGGGYVFSALLEQPHSGGTACTRVPCDEDYGYADVMIPWPMGINEVGAGEEELEMTFCLRSTASGEGTAGSKCEVHLEFEAGGAHTYELGHLDGPNDPAEVFCENNPPNPTTHPTLSVPTSFEFHLETSGAVETVEVIH